MIIDYQKLLDDAMLQLIIKVLKHVKNNGLHGKHHFYISFRTDQRFVVLSKRMKAKYPKEITIVLQHQFNKLRVYDDKFCVALSFDGVNENISVPYNALTSFIDPSAEFSVQFKNNKTPISINNRDNDTVNASDELDVKNIKPKDNVIALDIFRKKKK